MPHYCSEWHDPEYIFGVRSIRSNFCSAVSSIPRLLFVTIGKGEKGRESEWGRHFEKFNGMGTSWYSL